MTDYITAHRDETDTYHREAVRLAGQFGDATVDGEGVVRWNSNDRVPPKDIRELWHHLGYLFNMDNSDRVEREDVRSVVEQYRKNYTGPSDEERFEARSAHGPGVELVNVFTGHRWRT